jgi:hypothetical protein
LTEKLEEIDHRQQAKRNALAKIDDTLTQSEIGKESVEFFEFFQQSIPISRVLQDH